MSDNGKNETERGEWLKRVARLGGSLPWMKPRDKKHYRAKRKFNIAKVAGSATNLELINDDDRVFEKRSLLRGDFSHAASVA